MGVNSSPAFALFFVVLPLCWGGVVWTLFRAKKTEAIAVAIVRAVSSQIDWSCFLYSFCVVDPDRLINVATNNEAAWAAIAMQLMTYELPDAYRWVQFVIVAAVLNGVGAFFSVRDEYAMPTAEFILCLVVIPMNWYLSRVRLPMHRARFWGPIIMLFMSYAVYAFVAAAGAKDEARALWYVSYLVVVIFTAASLRDWISPTPVPPPSPEPPELPTGSDVSGATGASIIELPTHN